MPGALLPRRVRVRKLEEEEGRGKRQILQWLMEGKEHDRMIDGMAIFSRGKTD